MNTLIKISDLSDKLSRLIELLDDLDNSDQKIDGKQFFMVHSLVPTDEKIFLPSDYMTLNKLDRELIGEMDKSVDLIIENFNPKKIWIALYTYGSSLNFHIDFPTRHIVNLNNNENFYFYELVPPAGDNPKYSPTEYCDLFTEKMKNMEINEFNTYFLSEGNRILKLDSGCVYTYDEPIGHSVFNNDKSKVRCSIIFDI